MTHAPGRVRFLGDLSDPWVAELSDGLAGEVERHSIPGPLGRFNGAAGTPWVVHRSLMATGDLAWFRGALEAGQGSNVLLIAGPHVRFHQLQRCQGWVDQVVPESSARVVSAGWLDERWGGRSRPRIATPAPAVAVSSRTRELGLMLVQALKDTGRSADLVEGPPASARERVVLWEAPVLERGWDRELIEARRAGKSVVAMIGLADRELARRAIGCGAEAVLDLPCALRDAVREVERAIGRVPRLDPARGDLAGPHAGQTVGGPRRLGTRFPSI